MCEGAMAREPGRQSWCVVLLCVVKRAHTVPTNNTHTHTRGLGLRARGPHTRWMRILSLLLAVFCLALAQDLAEDSSGGPPAPRPSSLLHLFVGFPAGSCEPYGDHPAALYAARLDLAGGKWLLSQPSQALSSLQLSGITNALGVDTASGTAWGSWLLGAPGPPYYQQTTALRIGSGRKAPSVLYTCSQPRPTSSGPWFDKRVSPSSPFYYSNGSFVVLGDPSVASSEERWDEPSAEWPSQVLRDEEELAALVQASAGALVPLTAGVRVGGAASLPASTPAPNCTLRVLGEPFASAPGAAVMFDATTAQPSAVFVTLTAAATGRGATVGLARVAVLSGALLSEGTAPCDACDMDFGGLGLAAKGMVFFATINYTNSQYSVWGGKAAGGQPFQAVRASDAVMPRWSTSRLYPSLKGIGAPFPLGVGALRVSTPTDNAACHNATQTTLLQVAAAARASAAFVVTVNLSVAMCALPTSAGGCILPMVGFA